MVCLPPPTLHLLALLLSLAEFPPTRLPKKWQLGPQFEAFWLPPASKLGLPLAVWALGWHNLQTSRTKKEKSSVVEN